MLRVFSLLVGMASVTAWAAPGEFKIFAPSKVERSRQHLRLTVTVVLPCRNADALDWSSPVLSSDDSGDRVVVVGVAVAMSQCQAGRARTFRLSVDPRASGYELDGSVTFEPMTVAR